MSIINNSFTDNGGIFLFSQQNLNKNSAPQTGTLRNIEVNGNSLASLADTKSQWSSYIVADVGVVSPNFIWGTGLDGIEMRNNSIATRPGNPIGIFTEGYWNLAQYQDGAAPYSPNSAAPAVLGTVDTIIWNSYTNNVAIKALGQTPVIKDQRISDTATQASVGTVVGHD